jgi:hypothetical protein
MLFDVSQLFWLLYHVGKVLSAVDDLLQEGADDVIIY